MILLKKFIKSKKKRIVLIWKIKNLLNRNNKSRQKQVKSNNNNNKHNLNK
jgi:hypothetical protein